MPKDKVFVLRLSEQDLHALQRVALATKRSKSSVFRWALHEVASAIDEHPEKLRLLEQAKEAA